MSSERCSGLKSGRKSAIHSAARNPLLSILLQSSSMKRKTPSKSRAKLQTCRVSVLSSSVIDSSVQAASEQLRARAADLMERACEQTSMQSALDATCKALRLEGGAEELQVCLALSRFLVPQAAPGHQLYTPTLWRQPTQLGAAFNFAGPIGMHHPVRGGVQEDGDERGRACRQDVRVCCAAPPGLAATGVSASVPQWDSATVSSKAGGDHTSSCDITTVATRSCYDKYYCESDVIWLCTHA